MKQLLLFVAVSTVLFSCTSSTDNINNENLALIKKYVQAVESNDTAAMSAILADNYKGYGPAFSDSTTKAEALANWKYNADNLYESIKYTRFQNVAINVKEGEEAEPGDWVSNWALLTIKYKDGRGPINLWVNAVYKIENGKVVMSRTAYDEADALRQLNYQFLPPEQ